MKCETMNIITHLGLAMAWQQSTIVEEVRPMVILSEICQGKKCKHVVACTCCLDRFRCKHVGLQALWLHCRWCQSKGL